MPKPNNPRKIAVEILSEILIGGAYNNISLREAFSKYKELSINEKGFITDVVNGTLRHLLHIDYIIGCFAKGRTKPFVKNVLRISVYQLFYTQNPSYAILNEANELIKNSKFKANQSFVNGILRNIDREKENITYPADKREVLSIKYSLPRHLLDYLLSFLEIEDVEEFLKGTLVSPSVSICTNNLKTNAQALTQKLEQEGVKVEGSPTNADALKITKTNEITKLEAYTQGLFHIMDEVSMETVATLNPIPESIVYDLCAAPGGKTFYMAQKMQNKGKIYASDLHAHKIKLIEDGASRLGIDIIETTCMDATKDKLQEDFADFVLLDAPCSGLGIIRKKPDIKYTKTIEDIKSIAEVQKKLLKNSSKYAKIGQYLVYSTCTISKLENQDNIKWFLENFDYEKITEKQYINAHTDGFYIALLQRRG